MRKRSIALLVAVLISITGCNSTQKNQEVNSEPTEVVTTLPAETSNSAMPEPDTTPEADVTPNGKEEAVQLGYPKIEISEIHKEYTSEDGKRTTLYFGRQSATLVDGAREEFPDLARELDTYFEDNGSAMERLAEEWSKEVQEWVEENEIAEESELSYSLNQVVKQLRNDRKILSLMLREDSYRGGPHGNSTLSGATFDVETGKELLFSDVIWDMEGFKMVAEDFIVHTVEHYIPDMQDVEEYGFYPEYKETIADKMDHLDFVLTDYGMRVFFQEYEIAPYAAGVIVVDIPYSYIRDFMKEAYVIDETSPKLFEIGMYQEYCLDFGDKGANYRVYVTRNDENNMISNVTLKSEEQELVVYQSDHQEGYVDGKYFFMRNINGKAYLLATFELSDGSKETFVYKVENGKFVQTDEVQVGLLDDTKSIYDLWRVGNNEEKVW